ncbi:helix-turn-helix domain-containing protein [Clostridium sp. CX1]|uniref:Helix-turn-helix domain-containing protein n=1 Tax=Clostridium tanneri TaxID=3037988 RepID=A0ABU4JTK5_9CLOT|nr:MULTISPECIES: helix-turn-helix domain-containing protein [unclassified Clostridium]MCT8975333.1 helix-turn-helix domain-containing protein [Clostridium sp. CX1]MDW8801436.1 helix-turn-helix domain-containing protein [Clostridium sp. A1-XYC3]
MGKISIGRKIIEYRRSKGLTIRDFSELTGLSASLLSQLERDMANPTLSVLQSIADTLQIPLSSLFMEEIDNKSLILKKEDRKQIFNPDEKHVLYDILTPSPLKSNVELLLMNLKANSETYGGFSEHEGEEIAFVLEGETYIVFENEEFLLYEGDTARILPNRKHKFKNSTDKDVKVLFIKSKPIY